MGCRAGRATQNVGNNGTYEHRPEFMSVSHYPRLGQPRGPAKAGQSPCWHAQQAGGSENLKEESGRSWRNCRPRGCSMPTGWDTDEQELRCPPAPSTNTELLLFPLCLPNLKQIPLVASPNLKPHRQASRFWETLSA